MPSSDFGFHVIGTSYHMKRSARMRRGACNEDVATQPHLAQESVPTDSLFVVEALKIQKREVTTNC